MIKLLLWLFFFLENAAVFEVFESNETVDCRKTCVNCFLNSNLQWNQFFRSSSYLNHTPLKIIHRIERYFS